MADAKEETIIADDEEVIEEDKTSEEDKPEENEEEKTKRSDIAQKIKYREKYQEASSKVSKLETELAELKGMVKKPAVGDDAEARAQEYIRSQAKAVYEELLNARKSEEERTTRQFEEKVEAVLEENPDISEEELLDAIEEYEVEPKIALKILRKSSVKKEKPKMPQSKRASTEGEPEKGKADDSKKTMWQILQEEAKKLKK